MQQLRSLLTTASPRDLHALSVLVDQMADKYCARREALIDIEDLDGFDNFRTRLQQEVTDFENARDYVVYLKERKRYHFYAMPFNYWIKEKHDGKKTPLP